MRSDLRWAGPGPLGTEWDEEARKWDNALGLMFTISNGSHFKTFGGMTPRPLAPRLTAGGGWLESESTAGTTPRAPNIRLIGPYEDGTSKESARGATPGNGFMAGSTPSTRAVLTAIFVTLLIAIPLATRAQEAGKVAKGPGSEPTAT